MPNHLKVCARRQKIWYKISDYEYEITIIFNEEQIPDFSVMEILYRWLVRKPLYGRTEDVETFKILLEQGNSQSFTFEKIYSGQDTIDNFMSHGDQNKPIPKHKIETLLIAYAHPKVFVNTSNHALAEHDNNRNLWKWEYAPQKNNPSIIYGEKSRNFIDKVFGGLLQALKNGGIILNKTKILSKRNG